MTPVTAAPRVDENPPLGRPVAWRQVSLVASGLLLVLVALSRRYGTHRDELYFVVAGQHPAWGYPDQPPLTPLLAAATQAVAPGSVVALHVPAALCVTAICALTAAMAAELGGDRWAQVVAALAVALGAGYLVIGHELSTTTVDVLVWTAILAVALRVLLRDRPRGWPLVGLLAGVGLENTTLIVALLLTLAAGVLLTSATRHHLRTGWFWLAVLLALLLAVPNLVWQAAHSWPQLALAGDINHEYGGLGARVAYVVMVLINVGPLAVPLWAWGGYRLARDPGWTRARPVAWAFGLMFVGFLVVGGKGYYLAGLYPPPLAAGAVSAERARVARRWLSWLVPAALVAGLLPVLPAMLPVLPESVYAASPYTALVEDPKEMIGWPRLAAAVAAAQDALPADQRAGAVVLASNYGEAGAVAWFRRDLALPPVYGGHNGFAQWGPPPPAAPPVILVGRFDPSGVLTGCHQVGVARTGVSDEENGAPVRICSGPVGTWARVWPQITFLAA